MTLLELRKYAIEHRSEIRFTDRLGHECLVSEKGQVRIPGEDKDFHVEEALEAAEGFEIISGGQAHRLSREAMAGVITQASGIQKAEAAAGEDE
ncbi:MAG TPA: hypothetical protein VNQ79_05685 [Blastocatellia bacterium]|nr:hypothetical protein [Blastocatellia bacterium]